MILMHASDRILSVTLSELYSCKLALNLEILPPPLEYWDLKTQAICIFPVL